MERAYLVSTRLLNSVLFIVGLVLVAVTLIRGGGALALGVVVGLLFALLGAGRLWLARRGAGER